MLSKNRPFLQYKQRQEIRKMIDEQSKEYLEKKVEEVKLQTIEAIFASFIVAIHDEFGFGKTRMDRLLEKAISQFESIQAGTVSVDEIITLSREFYTKKE